MTHVSPHIYIQTKEESKENKIYIMSTTCYIYDIIFYEPVRI